MKSTVIKIMMRVDGGKSSVAIDDSGVYVKRRSTVISPTAVEELNSVLCLQRETKTNDKHYCQL